MLIPSTIPASFSQLAGANIFSWMCLYNVYRKMLTSSNSLQRKQTKKRTYFILHFLNRYLQYILVIFYTENYRLTKARNSAEGRIAFKKTVTDFRELHKINNKCCV